LPWNVKGKTQLFPGWAPEIVEQEELGALVVVVVVCEVPAPGQAEPQSPHFPSMCLPFHLVFVEHHGVENPPAVVQEV